MPLGDAKYKSSKFHLSIIQVTRRDKLKAKVLLLLSSVWLYLFMCLHRFSSVFVIIFLLQSSLFLPFSSFPFYCHLLYYALNKSMITLTVLHQQDYITAIDLRQLCSLCNLTTLFCFILMLPTYLPSHNPSYVDVIKLVLNSFNLT